MIRNLLLLIVFAMGICALPVCSSETATPRLPVVVMIDKAPTGFVYKVNSKATGEILLALSRMRESNPDPRPKSILLVHEDVTLTMINGMRGVMSKAGYVFPDQRIFFFNRDNVKNVMTELKFSTPVRFSAGGDIPEAE